MDIYVDVVGNRYITTEQFEPIKQTFKFTWDTDRCLLYQCDNNWIIKVEDLDDVFKKIKGRFYGTSYKVVDISPGVE